MRCGLAVAECRGPVGAEMDCFVDGPDAEGRYELGIGRRDIMQTSTKCHKVEKTKKVQASIQMSIAYNRTAIRPARSTLTLRKKTRKKP